VRAARGIAGTGEKRCSEFAEEQSWYKSQRRSAGADLAKLTSLGLSQALLPQELRRALHLPRLALMASH